MPSSTSKFSSTFPAQPRPSSPRSSRRWKTKIGWAIFGQVGTQLANLASDLGIHRTFGFRKLSDAGVKDEFVSKSTYEKGASMLHLHAKAPHRDGTQTEDSQQSCDIEARPEGPGHRAAAIKTTVSCTMAAASAGSGLAMRRRQADGVDEAPRLNAARPQGKHEVNSAKERRARIPQARDDVSPTGLLAHYCVPHGARVTDVAEDSNFSTVRPMVRAFACPRHKRHIAAVRAGRCEPAHGRSSREDESTMARVTERTRMASRKPFSACSHVATAEASQKHRSAPAQGVGPANADGERTAAGRFRRAGRDGDRVRPGWAAVACRVTVLQILRRCSCPCWVPLRTRRSGPPH